jgi:hypothetical protein
MATYLSATAAGWREGRRPRAGELHEQGWSQSQIAAALGVTSEPFARGCAAPAKATAPRRSASAKLLAGHLASRPIGVRPSPSVRTPSRRRSGAPSALPTPSARGGGSVGVP